MIFPDCAHKSDLRHNPCILIFSCCAHKFHPRHKKGNIILSCCTHKSDFPHKKGILIFPLRVYTCFVALTFCGCPNTLCNTLLIDFFLFLKHSNNKKRLHFVHCFFSILISHQDHEKYKWSLKIKWTI